MTRRRHFTVFGREQDLGDGWYVQRENLGAGVWYYASLLDAPGGRVIGGFRRRFSYKRDAVRWVEANRNAPEVVSARAVHGADPAVRAAWARMDAICADLMEDKK